MLAKTSIQESARVALCCCLRELIETEFFIPELIDERSTEGSTTGQLVIPTIGLNKHPNAGFSPTEKDCCCARNIKRGIEYFCNFGRLHSYRIYRDRYDMNGDGLLTLGFADNDHPRQRCLSLFHEIRRNVEPK
jgi:hypothetical protein